MEVESAAPAAQDFSSEGLFVRKSSGLVREIGVRDTLGIGLGALVLMGAFSNVAVFTQYFPNGDYYLPIIIGGLICLVLTYAYVQLVGTFPRSGGEYVYASRVFGPVFGAAVGGAVLVAVCLNCGNTVVQLGQIFVPLAFSTVGDALHIHALVTFGDSTLAHKTAYLIVGFPPQTWRSSSALRWAAFQHGQVRGRIDLRSLGKARSVRWARALSGLSGAVRDLRRRCAARWLMRCRTRSAISPGVARTAARGASFGIWGIPSRDIACPRPVNPDRSGSLKCWLRRAAEYLFRVASHQAERSR